MLCFLAEQEMRRDEMMLYVWVGGMLFHGVGLSFFVGVRSRRRRAKKPSERPLIRTA